MAKFISEVRHLVLQDGAVTNAKSKDVTHPEPWAVFVDHVLETVDQKVIARLKSVEGVSEATADSEK